ncbi:PqiC family protein [Pelagicoccus sp. SDUM812002]|uniref:PqiC family protein n=1 Tax=Pelagicoccus sp. SDUM812002 TaxID=3041266 RepID=UPI00280EBC1A|nr:PqiC family protein [Pelagicoccus sp. SDUM812002]MDQ8186577.1 PqiC family protein [Pelagicoccus sp. SDUM812002]
MNDLQLSKTKRAIRAVLMWVGVVVLVGCQSRPAAEVHYYLLQPSVNDLPREFVEVANIELPAYLKSSSVMLGVSDNEIRPAQYHLWSEPMEEGMRRVLEAELVSRLKYVDREVVPMKIDLKVELFHATASGRVILKGVWRIRGDDAQRSAFSIQMGIGEGGYPAAVRAHVSALASLTDEIAKSL